MHPAFSRFTRLPVSLREAAAYPCRSGRAVYPTESTAGRTGGGLQFTVVFLTKMWYDFHAKEFVMEIVARIHNDYSEKFGVPRQAGLAEHTVSRVVMEPDFRIREAFRGIEVCSHIWLIWGFSENEKRGWTPTVRPPQLGGNTRLGVFATRSPYRPNGLGISAVKLESVDLNDPDGAFLTVSGADLMDGTPIYDIKPYVAYADAHPEATDVLAGRRIKTKLKVICSERLLSPLTEPEKLGLIETLELDPRPAYQDDPERIYGIAYAGRNVRFRVKDKVLTVISLEKSMGALERKM